MERGGPFEPHPLARTVTVDDDRPSQLTQGRFRPHIPKAKAKAAPPPAPEVPEVPRRQPVRRWVGPIRHAVPQNPVDVPEAARAPKPPRNMWVGPIYPGPRPVPERPRDETVNLDDNPRPDKPKPKKIRKLKSNVDADADFPGSRRKPPRLQSAAKREFDLFMNSLRHNADWWIRSAQYDKHKQTNGIPDPHKYLTYMQERNKVIYATKNTNQRNLIRAHLAKVIEADIRHWKKNPDLTLGIDSERNRDSQILENLDDTQRANATWLQVSPVFDSLIFHEHIKRRLLAYLVKKTHPQGASFNSHVSWPVRDEQGNERFVEDRNIDPRLITADTVRYFFQTYNKSKWEKRTTEGTDDDDEDDDDVVMLHDANAPPPGGTDENLLFTPVQMTQENPFPEWKPDQIPSQEKDASHPFPDQAPPTGDVEKFRGVRPEDPFAFSPQDVREHARQSKAKARVRAKPYDRRNRDLAIMNPTGVQTAGTYDCLRELNNAFNQLDPNGRKPHLWIRWYAMLYMVRMRAYTAEQNHRNNPDDAHFKKAASDWHSVLKNHASAWALNDRSGLTNVRHMERFRLSRLPLLHYDQATREKLDEMEEYTTAHVPPFLPPEWVSNSAFREVVADDIASFIYHAYHDPAFDPQKFLAEKPTLNSHRGILRALQTVTPKIQAQQIILPPVDNVITDAEFDEDMRRYGKLEDQGDDGGDDKGDDDDNDDQPPFNVDDMTDAQQPLEVSSDSSHDGYKGMATPVLKAVEQTDDAPFRIKSSPASTPEVHDGTPPTPEWAGAWVRGLQGNSEDVPVASVEPVPLAPVIPVQYATDTGQEPHAGAVVPFRPPISRKGKERVNPQNPPPSTDTETDAPAQTRILPPRYKTLNAIRAAKFDAETKKNQNPRRSERQPQPTQRYVDPNAAIAQLQEWQRRMVPMDDGKEAERIKNLVEIMDNHRQFGAWMGDNYTYLITNRDFQQAAREYHKQLFRFMQGEFGWLATFATGDRPGNVGDLRGIATGLFGVVRKWFKAQQNLSETVLEPEEAPPTPIQEDFTPFPAIPVDDQLDDDLMDVDLRDEVVRVFQQEPNLPTFEYLRERAEAQQAYQDQLQANYHNQRILDQQVLQRVRQAMDQKIQADMQAFASSSVAVGGGGGGPPNGPPAGVAVVAPPPPNNNGQVPPQPQPQPVQAGGGGGGDPPGGGGGFAGFNFGQFGPPANPSGEPRYFGMPRPQPQPQPQPQQPQQQQPQQQPQQPPPGDEEMIQEGYYVENEEWEEPLGGTLARNRVHPGRARLQGVFNPMRDQAVQANIYRPCNRFRSQMISRGIVPWPGAF